MNFPAQLRRRLAGLASATVVITTAAEIQAQSSPVTRQIEGQVTRAARGGRSVPLAGQWVVLHRVGLDAAAPIDSQRTRANGRYAFRYRPTGDTTAIYFVSTSRGGVAYFTAPSREPIVRGDAADLLVFDTTSAPMPLTLRGRHIIVTAPDTATPLVRSIVEVYELSNDSAVTLVPGAEGRHTYEVPLPSGVTEVQGGEGDVSPDAMRVEQGRLRVYAPIAPGIKQFSFFYDLPITAALAYPIDEPVPVLEVLVEDARGNAVGAELLEVNSVQVEGRPFKRFLAQNVVAPSVVDITAPGASASTRALRLMLVVTAIGAAMLLALGAAMLRRSPAGIFRRREPNPESLALEIAALDARFEALAAPTAEERSAHQGRRMQLKSQLSAALAKRDELT